MNLLIAPDKFKGSLTAAQAARAIRRGAERVLPDADCRELPIADGGEGTAEALCAAKGGEWVTVSAHDALDRPIQAGYGSLPGAAAVLNMSEVSGLWRITSQERDLWNASTFGTGELMAHARQRGARKILVGLGGSATNDGGLGAAAALGWQFIDKRGRMLDPRPCHLLDVARIIQPENGFDGIEVVAMSDVGNPLLGPNGASWIYGPQKGGDALVLTSLEAGLTHFADVAASELGQDFRNAAGAGAAGGLGFGLLTFCGARLRSGFDVVTEALGLREAVAGCDLVITGEGCLDRQTLEGKGPAGVASLARHFGKPVLAFGGAVLDAGALGQLFDGVFALKDETITTETAMRDAESLLERKAAAALAAWNNQNCPDRH